MFGDLVRMYRRRRGLTQEELAESLGINVRTIGKIEANRIAVPRPATMGLLADAFGLTGDERERFYDAAGDAVPPSRATSKPDGGVGGSDGADTPVRPAQLPANVAGFVGRGEQLDQLTTLIDDVNRDEEPADGRAVVITAIGGTAGVGKTALAIRWAHRVRSDFPDGQLYVNLRGYDPDEPMAATDALAGFLRALGVASGEIPPTLDERAAAYRTLLAGRRMLLLLDNASSEEQVRPLLPGVPSCIAVVTSRDSLAGLVAREGAVRVPVDVLSLSDSVALLRGLIGRRVDEDAAAAAALAQRCARLPLALRVAAEVAAGRPTVPLADLVTELGDEQAHLHLFDAGTDDRTRVPVVFSWSYRGLPGDAARLFRRCGLLPAAEITAHAAATMLETSVEYANVLLDLLVRAHLAHQTAPDRYAMHDLLRAYAANVAAAVESEVERHATLTRTFDYYLVTAANATEVLHPGESQRRPVITATAVVTPPVADPAAALAWLDRELPTLARICTYAATHDWAGHAIQFSAVLYRHLNVSGHPEAQVIHVAAGEAARRKGDSAAEGAADVRLGIELGRRGAITEAEQALLKGIDLARQAGDEVTEGMGVGALAIMCWFLGRYSDTAALLEQGLELHRRSGDIIGQSAVLQNLGVLRSLQGRWRESREHFTGALAKAAEIGFRGTEVNILCCLADLDIHQGHFAAAEERLDDARRVALATGDRLAETAVLRDVGLLRLCQRRFDEAVEPLTKALGVYQPLGILDNTIAVLSRLGEVRRWQGDYGSSAELLEQALALLRSKGDVSEQCLALNRLGMTRHAMGELEDARSLLTEAIALSIQAGLRYTEAMGRAALADVHWARDLHGPALEELRRAAQMYEEMEALEAVATRTRIAKLSETIVAAQLADEVVSTIP